MSYRACDIYKGHQFSTEGLSGWFDETRVDLVESAANFPRGCWSGDVGVMVYQGHDDGRAWFVNSRGDTMRIDVEVVGDYCVAIREAAGNFVAYGVGWLRDRSAVVLYEWTITPALEMVAEFTHPQQAGSQGIAFLLGDAVIYRDSITTATWNGRLINLPMLTGSGYGVGQDNKSFYIVCHDGMGTLYTVGEFRPPHEVQIAPRIDEFGNIALTGDFPKHFYTRSDWQPFDTSAPPFQAPPFEMDRMQRGFAVACFHATPDAPGNATIFPDPDTEDSPDNRHTFTGEFRPTVAIWCDKVRGDDGEIELTLEQDMKRRRPLSRILKVPLVCHVDGDWVDPEGILLSDVRAVQAFRRKGETIAQFGERTLRNCHAAFNANRSRFMLVAGAYDRNGDLSEAEMAEAFSVYRGIVYSVSACVGVLFFGWNRGDGTLKHLWLKDYIRAFADASPGLPDLRLPPVTDPPFHPLDPPLEETPPMPETPQQTHERLAVRIYGMTTFDRFPEEQKFAECVKAVRTIMDTLKRPPIEPEAVMAVPIYAKTWGPSSELDAWAETRKTA